jgi:uncharacterized Zn finger protein (UPF0148 family)
VANKWVYRCRICGLFRKRQGQTMCDPCGRSYDTYAHDTGTVMEAMEWAANRARRFAVRAKRERGS